MDLYKMPLKQLYAWLNKTVETTGVACKKGCAFCCYIPVECTKEEVDLCLELAEPGEVKQGDFAPCPFLDRKNKSCRVYEYRPLACRGMTSTSKVKCEKAYRKRDNKMEIPADGETYTFFWKLAIGRGGEKRRLTEWLDAHTIGQD